MKIKPDLFIQILKIRLTFLTSKNRLNKSLTLKGRARITGDYDDHINIREGISSLMIRLKKNNLGGITKFRLLLPVTRNGNSEIFGRF